MKRSNLQVMGVAKREEHHNEGTENIFNNLIKENVPNIKKEIPTQIQEVYGKDSTRRITPHNIL